MKNVILSAILAVTVLTSAFATGENKISSVVLNSFKAEFKNVTNVSWSSKTGYSKAAFILNDRQMEVFYDENGYVVARSKNIALDELPVSAKRAFAKRYGGYNVTEAIQFDGINEQAYYLKAENGKESIILKVGETCQLSFFQKERKPK